MSSELSKKSYRIFISYARADSTDLALKLRNDLSTAGHDVWLDLAEIAAGASWARDIEEAIENCDLALILLSHGSYASDICRGEQLRAQRKGKRIIPILLQADADRPLNLEPLNYLDFSDSAQYPKVFDELIHYIVTGVALPPPLEMLHETNEMETQALPPLMSKSPSTVRKRDSRAFKRYLTDLRQEPWLGERYWWTYFLFYFADVNEIAQILTNGEITPPLKNRRSDRWDRMVRLYFRPRTPDLWGSEGLRPAEKQMVSYCPLPVYLLFDIEGVLTLAETRFSEGDVTQTKKTFKAASAFRDLPFDLIYHDSWVPKQNRGIGERNEILSARRAQVIVPEALDLTHLNHILCRTEAERETLLTLLPDSIRERWLPKITVREDYNLFNNKWAFVNRATLSSEGVHFQFHACEAPCEMFHAWVKIEALHDPAQMHMIDLGEIPTDNDLALDLTTLQLHSGYRLSLYLDDALAYAGRTTLRTQLSGSE